ncbi:M23 family metallopeptidase [Paracoccus isoporae]|nr:M23 family metallopeptidase [Paracoccus isoporae]
MSRSVYRGVMAVSLSAVLAGCQAFPAVQQDLGRLGGVIGGAGRASNATAAPAAGAEAMVRDPFAGQGVAQPDVPGGGRTSAGSPPAVDDGATSGSATVPATTHRVVAGETGWSIARRYGITIQQLAEANQLDESMMLRVGQSLNIPARSGTTASQDSSPGQGTPTPTPPSASRPLPDEETSPASAPVDKPDTPDLGATRTGASGSGQFRMPVSGAIVRAYSKGRNDGIDISAASGTPVAAAGSGTVVAITRDPENAPIVVMRHANNLLTVYAGLSGLSVQKGDQVSAGQQIGTAGASGAVHFEVRDGFESLDPEDYL